ncbi:FkbM family methyltransferase [Pelagibacteraceae bacterium]|nr:FkbM family methyltransferase [Pelagibacteraceae bacterium]
MIYKNYIFDVGANEGIDGLALAINNQKIFIHAFEPNPDLIKIIKKLKKKLENRIGRAIKNYKIHNYAVGNVNKISKFNISINHRVSSLNTLSANIEKTWPGYKESVFKVTKQIRVKVITLNYFMKKNKINHINYLHTDTQGHDLNVLKGLGKRINNIFEGKMEVSLNKKTSAYKNNHTLKDVKKIFSKTSLKINKITNIDHISKNGIFNNEADITYLNSSLKNHIAINKKYNQRYYFRVLYNKTNFKDNISDAVLKFLNKSF